jgi:hypothetical protein
METLRGSGRGEANDEMTLVHSSNSIYNSLKYMVNLKLFSDKTFFYPGALRPSKLNLASPLGRGRMPRVVITNDNAPYAS